MTLFLDDGDVRLYLGDALETVRQLPDDSVDCVVTSPPYWGLRDYGTGEWDGGDPDCDHRVREDARVESSTLGGGKSTTGHQREGFKEECPRCGARRVDRQMGLEPTPDLFVQGMVELFREIRRVLAPHGTCWVNLGDSYAGAPVGSFNGGGFKDKSAATGGRDLSGHETSGKFDKLAASGLKQKDLVGIPWRVAFALQADGWWLRSDIIWAKPNPMPESVTDRPTKAHEYVFLLTKQPRYWFDTEAVREPAEWQRWGDQTNGKHEGQQSAAGWIGSASKEELQRRATKKPDGWDTGPGGHGTVHRDGREKGAENYVEAKGRNVRSVWQIATQPYPEAHFATYPEELARRCILAGCPTRVCRVCGKPSERIVERGDYEGRVRPLARTVGFGAHLRNVREAAGIAQSDLARHFPSRTGNPTGIVSNWETDKMIPSPEAYRRLKELLPGLGFDDLGRDYEGYTSGGWVSEPDPLGKGNAKDSAALTRSVGTVGWSDCGHNQWRPGTVLDPFIGSGTTAKVARDHQRHAIGIDLNEQYLELAARRLQQLSLLNAT